MRYVFSLLLLTMAAGFGYAQTTDTKYYRDRPFGKEVGPEKAKYTVTTESGNGIFIRTITNVKTQEVEGREEFHGDEAWGPWVGRTGKGPEAMDYNFKLVYETRDCRNSETLENAGSLFTDNSAIGYRAPVIPDCPDLMTFIGRNVRYPAKARRARIQGTVQVVFTVTREGDVKDVAVAEGIDVSLDKESVRVIRKLKFSTPPMLNGEPQELCVTFPVKFKMV